MEEALTVFDELLNEVPVYLLECRADEHAVNITYHIAFGKQGD